MRPEGLWLASDAAGPLSLVVLIDAVNAEAEHEARHFKFHGSRHDADDSNERLERHHT